MGFRPGFSRLNGERFLISIYRSRLLEQALRRARVSADTSQVALFNLGGGQTVTARVSRSGPDSLRLAIGNVRYHLRVDQAGRVLGGRIPAQDVVVERR